MLIADKATALTLTIKLQTDEVYLENSLILIENDGAGDLNIQATSGVILNNINGGSITLEQGQAGYLRRRSEDVWVMPNFTSVVP